MSTDTDTDAELKRLEGELRWIFQDKSNWQTFLQQNGSNAQYWLDSMQQLVDYPDTSPEMRPSIFSAALRLSKNSGLHPKCLAIQNVKKFGEFPIDAGGFGEVWKGTIGESTQPVCLKIMKIYRDSDVEKTSKEYLREAILWRQLKHPNVLPFLGIYQLEQQQLCLVSPWMQQGNLLQFLRATRREDVDYYTLVYDVAAGLSYLHMKKIVHSDLKGVNILMTDSLRACLGDFGLSRVADTHGLKITSTTRSCGTGRWLAPELLLENGGTSKASDIYAYGCVCYEIFTRQHPFPELPNEAAVALAVHQGKRPSRPKEISELADVMWALMETCWHATPSSRPDATQVVNQIMEMNLRKTNEPAPDWNESLFTQVWANVEYCSLEVRKTPSSTQGGIELVDPPATMEASLTHDRSSYYDPPPPYSNPPVVAVEWPARTETTASATGAVPHQSSNDDPSAIPVPTHAPNTQPSQSLPSREEKDIFCNDRHSLIPPSPPLKNEGHGDGVEMDKGFGGHSHPHNQQCTGSNDMMLNTSARPSMGVDQQYKSGNLLVESMIATMDPTAALIERQDRERERKGSGWLSKLTGGRANKGERGELTRAIGLLTTTALEDWGLVLDVCQRASASDANAKEATQALRREFKYGQPQAQLIAARLWAIMLRNSSDTFVGQSTSRKFLDTLEDLLLSSRTNPVVKERVLDVLAAAAFAGGSKKDTGFGGLWKKVKSPDKPDEGIPFDTDDAMFNPPPVLGMGRAGNRRSYIKTPQTQVSHSKEASDTLEEVKELGNPEDAPLDSAGDIPAVDTEDLFFKTHPDRSIAAEADIPNPNLALTTLLPSTEGAQLVSPFSSREITTVNEDHDHRSSAEKQAREPTPKQKKRRRPHTDATTGKIIPLEDDMQRLFAECLVAKGNADLLNQALEHMPPKELLSEEFSSKERAVVQEFRLKCTISQEFTAAQIPWALAGAERSRREAGSEVEETKGERLLGDLLAANEVLVAVLGRYEDCEKAAIEVLWKARRSLITDAMAGKIIPLEDDMRRLFAECLVAKGNADLLNQALEHMPPKELLEEFSPKERAVLQEFRLKCTISQEFIAAQIPWAVAGAERSRREAGSGVEETKGERLLGDLLAANEVLVAVLGRYEDCEKAAINEVLWEARRSPITARGR